MDDDDVDADGDGDGDGVFLSNTLLYQSASVKSLPGASSCNHRSFGPQTQPAIKFY